MKILLYCLICISSLSAQNFTKSFQHGVNGYWGGKAVDISSLSYAENNQNGTTFADGNSDWCIGYLKNTAHGYDIFPLMRFDSLEKYLPNNAVVVSARLTLTFVQWEKPVRVIGRYLAVDWEGDVYDPSGGVSSPKIGWSTRKQGVAWSGKGASSAGADFLDNTSFVIPDAQKKIPANGKAVYTIDLDPSVVQQWLQPQKNFGFKLETDTVGIHIYVAQHQRYLQGTQPKLEIEYKLPVTSVKDVSSLPDGFELKQNYPNPFNPSTTIEYTVGQNLPGLRDIGGVNVSLKIYDVLGNEIEALVNEQKRSGRYSVAFDASHLPSGVYFARLSSAGRSLMMKMTLMK